MRIHIRDTSFNDFVFISITEIKWNPVPNLKIFQLRKNAFYNTCLHYFEITKSSHYHAIAINYPDLYAYVSKRDNEKQ